MFKVYHRLTKAFKNIPFFNKQIAQESQFYAANRKEVLQHYRYLLKELPKIYPRRLQQRTIYLEICHLFHASKVLQSFEETIDRSNHLREFVKSIKEGDYTVIGSLLPARGGETFYLRHYLNRLKYRLQ